MLCSLLSLCLERGEGRECWSFILSRGESPFAHKSQVMEFAWHRLFSQPFESDVLTVSTLPFSFSPLKMLGSFISLLPSLCCPFLLSKCTEEVSECPGWAGLVFPADWEGRSSKGAWSLPLLIAGIVFTWHFHTVTVLLLPNTAEE